MVLGLILIGIGLVVVVITLLSIEVHLRKAHEQNEEMIKLLKLIKEKH